MNFILFLHLFVNSFIFKSVAVTLYTQREIEETLKKYQSKTLFYRKYDNHLGCWPNNIIPYLIDDSFESYQVRNIQKHIRQIQDRTCLRWTPLKNMSNATKYLKFEHSTDSYLCHFKEAKNNTHVISIIALGDLCFPEKSESVIHEMLHALGFTHEHQRIDRDCYVVVDEDVATSIPHFKIIYDDLTFQRWPYDKRSILHYRRSDELRDKDEPFGGWLWHIRLGDETPIFTLNYTGEQTGQLTYLDVYKINYRFCGAPDFCDTRPELCDRIGYEEQEAGCISKQLWDLALGKVIKSI